MTDTKSLLRITEKDIDKLNKSYAKAKIYIEGVIREQESLLDAAEKRIREINSELDSLGKVLKRYIETGEKDSEVDKSIDEYRLLIVKRSSLQKAIVVVGESIERAKLNLL